MKQPAHVGSNAPTLVAPARGDLAASRECDPFRGARIFTKRWLHPASGLLFIEVIRKDALLTARIILVEAQSRRLICKTRGEGFPTLHEAFRSLRKDLRWINESAVPRWLPLRPTGAGRALGL